MSDKLERSPLESTAEIIKQADEAVALIEMRRALVHQAERDIVIEEIRKVVSLLVSGQVELSEEVATLRHALTVLQRQQREGRERQDIIAAVCDAFAKKIEEQAKITSVLVEHVTDVTEP